METVQENHTHRFALQEHHLHRLAIRAISGSEYFYSYMECSEKIYLTGYHK